MKSYRTVAVIPAYNEEGRIGKTLKNAKKFVEKIIVVDDGSGDRTSQVSRKAGAKVIRYDLNRGVGYATRVGLKEALKSKPDAVIFLDADGQLEPKYIPEFIEKVKSGYDYVYGLRDFSIYPLERKIGNFGLTVLTNMLCPTGIMDTECGYKALTYSAAKKVRLKSNRYEKDIEFAFEAWRNKFKIGYVRIKVPVFHPKSAVMRGFRNFFYLLKIRFSSKR
jgi:glycosyltransferase involved in cell wall biosynthesis